MRTNKTRLAVVSGATLALVVASTAAVAAHPGDDRDRGFRGQGDIQRGFGQFGERGLGRMGQRGILRGAVDDFERRETSLQTADGVTVHRVEQGTVDSASDTGLTFSLGSGESVTVVIDEDTNAFAVSEQEVTTRRGFERTRMVPSEVEVAEIAVGSEIFVWSDSEDGADFVAQRIVVQPELEADDEATDTESGDDAATEDSASAPIADA